MPRLAVIPAKAGIHPDLALVREQKVDSRLRGNDDRMTVVLLRRTCYFFDAGTTWAISEWPSTVSVHPLRKLGSTVTCGCFSADA